MQTDKNGRPELIDVMAEASMRALAMYAHQQGRDGLVALPALRAVVKAEYQDFLGVMKDAMGMGDEMHRHIINVYACAWASQALNG